VTAHDPLGERLRGLGAQVGAAGRRAPMDPADVRRRATRQRRARVAAASSVAVLVVLAVVVGAGALGAGRDGGPELRVGGEGNGGAAVPGPAGPGTTAPPAPTTTTTTVPVPVTSALPATTLPPTALPAPTTAPPTLAPPRSAPDTTSCARENLRLDPRVVGAAATEELTLTNTGRMPCAVEGFPTVFFVDLDATRVGPEAVPVGGPAARFVLAPGGRARFDITRVIAGTGACQADAAAQALDVYPPGERNGSRILYVTRACTDPGSLTVGPLRPD
jgi:hypothetical protein